jgi:hypothetical protein
MKQSGTVAGLRPAAYPFAASAGERLSYLRHAFQVITPLRKVIFITSQFISN